MNNMGTLGTGASGGTWVEGNHFGAGSTAGVFLKTCPSVHSPRS